MHVTDRQRKAADNLASGMSIRQSMIDAGYSVGIANEGIAGVPQRVIKLLGKKGMRLAALGEIDASTQEKITRGRLVYNVIQGIDKGAQSAKLLGSDRRVNMFTPDTQIGVIALVAPTEVHENMGKMLKELDGDHLKSSEGQS